mmetsp:Transcript_83224/g.252340  ORF Transcript_83224/g.252340 Transcript_83224/m.252340 type:complete len:207 (+) Transcript_83224:567-1187(+)
MARLPRAAGQGSHDVGRLPRPASSDAAASVEQALCSRRAPGRSGSRAATTGAGPASGHATCCTVQRESKRGGGGGRGQCCVMGQFPSGPGREGRGRCLPQRRSARGHWRAGPVLVATPRAPRMAAAGASRARLQGSGLPRFRGGCCRPGLLAVVACAPHRRIARNLRAAGRAPGRRRRGRPALRCLRGRGRPHGRPGTPLRAGRGP